EVMSQLCCRIGVAPKSRSMLLRARPRRSGSCKSQITKYGHIGQCALPYRIVVSVNVGARLQRNFSTERLPGGPVPRGTPHTTVNVCVWRQSCEFLRHWEG